jgi:hypothetical protein
LDAVVSSSHHTSRVNFVDESACLGCFLFRNSITGIKKFQTRTCLSGDIVTPSFYKVLWPGNFTVAREFYSRFGPGSTTFRENGNSDLIRVQEIRFWFGPWFGRTHKIRQITYRSSKSSSFFVIVILNQLYHTVD